MAPVAQALDVLQTEKDMYAGAYSVVISKLLQKLEKRTNLKFCENLKRAIIHSVNARYDKRVKIRNAKHMLFENDLLQVSRHS